jgi:hypothetical protein
MFNMPQNYKYKGKLDLEQHLQSATHKIHAKSPSASRPLSSFLVTNKDTAEVSAAEDVFAFHTVIHNISFTSHSEIVIQN